MRRAAEAQLQHADAELAELRRAHSTIAVAAALRSPRSPPRTVQQQQQHSEQQQQQWNLDAAATATGSVCAACAAVASAPVVATAPSDKVSYYRQPHELSI
jgi:hypothetical protein